MNKLKSELLVEPFQQHTDSLISKQSQHKISSPNLRKVEPNEENIYLVRVAAAVVVFVAVAVVVHMIEWIYF